MAILGWGIVMVGLIIASAAFIFGAFIASKLSGWDGEAKTLIILGIACSLVSLFWSSLRPFELIIKTIK